MWNFQRYRKVMGVWGSWSSSSPVKMNSSANFPVSCTCVQGFSYSQPVLHSAKEVLCTFGCWGLFTWAGFTLTSTSLSCWKVLSTFRWGQAEQQEKWSHWVLMYLQQVSHSTVISIQCGRPGLFMKPGAHHIYKRVIEWVPVCIFPRKWRFFGI